MSRYWDRAVIRRAYEIGHEKCRDGQAVGNWVTDHHQAYEERARTPLERSIQRKWSAPYEEPPCRQQHGARNESTRACLRCHAAWGEPCRDDDTDTD